MTATIRNRLVPMASASSVAPGSTPETGFILVLGGAHVDRRGRIQGETVIGASNPGHWIEEAGGGAFNAARNLSRLGHSVRMISPRGGDQAGDLVSSEAAATGIDDRPIVFLDRATPSYTAILDAAGDLVVALADMDLYRLFSPRRLRVRALRQSLADTDMVLCDANLPAETLESLAKATNRLGKPLAAIAISPAKVVRFRAALPHINMLFMNTAEAAALAGERPSTPEAWPALLRQCGLRGAVITDGKRPLIAYDAAGVARLTPSPVENVADVTGAGDAMAAGTLAGRLAGLSLDEALRMGTAASALTLQSFGATAKNLTPEGVNAQLALVPAAEILE